MDIQDIKYYFINTFWWVTTFELIIYTKCSGFFSHPANFFHCTTNNEFFCKELKSPKSTHYRKALCVSVWCKRHVCRCVANGLPFYRRWHKLRRHNLCLNISTHVYFIDSYNFMWSFYCKTMEILLVRVLSI